MSQPPSSREFDRDNLYGDYQQQPPPQARALPPPSSTSSSLPRPHGLPAPPSHPQGYENHQRGRSRSPQRGQAHGGGQGFARQDRGRRDEQQQQQPWQGGGGGRAGGGDWESSRGQDYRQGGPPPSGRDQSGWGASGAGDWRREEQERGRGGFQQPQQHQPYNDRQPPYQAAPPAWDDGRQGGGYDQHQQNAYGDPYGGLQQQQQGGGGYSTYNQDPQYHQQPPPSSGYDYDPAYASSSGPLPPAPKPPKKDGPSDVSRHIIFLGLDPDMREADLFNFLLASGAKVESTTIIKDKITGLSKGFGFALFAHTTAASDFLLSHFPAVLIPFNDLPPRRVKIDFSASTNQPGHSTAKNGWGAAAVASSPVNDGMRDIAPGGTGSVLLIRGVDVVTRWEEVLERLVNVEGGSGKGVKRVIGLRDRGTGGSWGFGFVEMRSAEFAKAFLAHAHSPTENPSGFQISRSSRPVSVSYANASSFLPQPGGGEGCIPGWTKGIGGVAGPVKYWDAGASIVELYAQGWEAAEASDNELAAFLTAITPLVSSMDPAAQQPPTVSSAPTASKINPPLAQEPLVSIAIKVPKPGADKPIMSIFGTTDQDEHDEEVANAAAAKAKGLIKIPPMSGSRKVASSISKWNTKQTELAADDSSLPQPSFAQAPPQASSSYRPTASTSQSTLSTPSIPSTSTSEEFEYSDTTKNACLLCQRQLKSLELLRKHNAGSDLHKARSTFLSLSLSLHHPLHHLSTRLGFTLLSDRFRFAKDRVLLAHQAQAQAAAAAAASEYRDRASERRTVFNQPVVPPSRSSHHSHSGPQTSFKGGRKFVEGPTAPPPPPPAGVAPGKDESNVGNKMLAKMGWKEGTGLGREGEGRVDPVMAASYASGSGLGASKPTEAGKYQDQGGYGQRARDGARDRY
ncbi:hypothetical protein BDY24DRAFT_417075 [Mrakia frigida]|uniref:uncharacterized protein n=1 Tax=Mrakia frigida TaxID=29902 RepID=UPI003FCC0E2D